MYESTQGRFVSNVGITCGPTLLFYLMLLHFIVYYNTKFIALKTLCCNDRTCIFRFSFNSVWYNIHSTVTLKAVQYDQTKAENQLLFFLARQLFVWSLIVSWTHLHASLWMLRLVVLIFCCQTNVLPLAYLASWPYISISLYWNSNGCIWNNVLLGWVHIEDWMQYCFKPQIWRM